MPTHKLQYSSGDKYNKLTLTGKTFRNTDGKLFAEVICECGKIVFKDLGSVVKGRTSSCGCARVKHGLFKHPLYFTWRDMIGRCGEKSESFKHYGAKGISVCKEWASDFKNFHDWAIENGWRKGLTIDRKDNSKGYDPSNCRCATFAQQNRNTSRNIFITAFGETRCVEDWLPDPRCVVTRTTVLTRLSKLKWSGEKALSHPNTNTIGNGLFRKNSIRLIYRGEEKKLSDWCRTLNLKYSTIANRIRDGWAAEEALETPTIVNKISQPYGRVTRNV